MLALVVAGSPPVHAAVPDRRLERGRIPVGQWPGRLDVIVPVDQHVRCLPAWLAGSGAEDQRAAFGLDDLRRQPAASDQLGTVGGSLREPGAVAAHARLPDPLRPLPDAL